MIAEFDQPARDAGVKVVQVCGFEALPPDIGVALATARLMAEAGLMLAAEGATPPRSGCLTPALALGADTFERFRAAGLRFDVADAGN